MENFKGKERAFEYSVGQYDDKYVSYLNGYKQAIQDSKAVEMLEKHYEEIEILEDILKNNPIGDVAFKLRMIIESKKYLLTRATTI